MEKITSESAAEAMIDHLRKALVWSDHIGDQSRLVQRQIIDLGMITTDLARTLRVDD